MSHLKQAARWAYSGISGSNAASPIVSEYITKGVLRKAGYQFGDSIDVFKAECFMIIEQEFGKIRKDEMKKRR